MKFKFSLLMMLALVVNSPILARGVLDASQYRYDFNPPVIAFLTSIAVAAAIKTKKEHNNFTLFMRLQREKKEGRSVIVPPVSLRFFPRSVHNNEIDVLAHYFKNSRVFWALGTITAGYLAFNESNGPWYLGLRSSYRI